MSSHIRADSLAISVLCVLGLTGIQRIVGLVRNVLFCRWMDAEQLGQWDLTFGFLLVAAPLTVMGLPGALGRYVDYFRSRGQLRALLLWSAASIACLATLAVTAIIVFRTSVAQLVFGRPEVQRLVILVAAALLAMVAFNTMCAFFTAMRLQRITSMLQVTYTFLFTLLAVALLLSWRASASSALLAHTAALGASCVLATFWLCKTWRATPETTTGSVQSAFLTQMVPFAAALWVTNALQNVLVLVDRYMIVHFTGDAASVALSNLGQYYVARMVPVLMITIASMLGAVQLPFLSRDWEAGNRKQVSDHIDFMLRVNGLACFTVAVLFLSVGPLLFAWLFGNKFDAGIALFNLTLMHAVFYSTFCVARLYLWCHRMGWLINAGLIAALLTNVTLNLILLPQFGLRGAAGSSCVAVTILLIAVYCSAWSCGMPIRIATVLISLLPLALVAGLVPALIVLGAVVVVAATTSFLFSVEEKSQMVVVARRFTFVT